MTRHKVYTLINVPGLALGICACLVIYLITGYEFSFDRFHPDAKRIYRITGEFQPPHGHPQFLNSLVPELAGIQNDIPGFEAKAGILYYAATVSIPGKASADRSFDGGNDVVITWPDYFKIFHYDWLAGNAATALRHPYEVVLTANKAKKYFGDLPPAEILGKTLIYNDSLTVKVAGIVRDWTGHSDLAYTDMIAAATITADHFLQKEFPAADWRSLQPHRSMVFVKLNRQTTAGRINAALARYSKSHQPPAGRGTLAKLELQPLSAIHFTDDYYRGDDGDNFRKAHLPTLYILMGIALFILLIAVVNFINLSTAQSIRRAKEVGVRKVLGGSKRSLVWQFLAETAIFTFLAILLAVCLVRPVLYLFHDFIPPGVRFDPLQPSTLLFLSLLLMVTALLAGFYPAKILSSYAPVLSLKGGSSLPGREKASLRKALIVFQFTISLVFIIGALVIRKQLYYMHNTGKGFNSDAVLTISNWGDNSGKLNVLREKIQQIPGVDKAIPEGTPPMGFAENNAVYTYKGKQETTIEVSTKLGNEDFIPFYNIHLIAGRNLAHSDSLRELVINETCARAMGFTQPAEAIGRLLYTGSSRAFPVVGVVSDFHLGSFHDPIKPVVIAHMPQWEYSIAVKLATKGKKLRDAQTILSKIGQQWKQLYPDKGFDYIFLDDYISWLFQKDEQAGWLVNIATLITIFISGMGLFGLAMFTAERRTKEIGIRKVLGAGVPDIAILLSKEFASLLGLALVIASPIAWYGMNRWLQDFAYRTAFSWWIFVVAGLGAGIIALVTIGFRTIKAATAKPVDTLRTE